MVVISPSQTQYLLDAFSSAATSPVGQENGTLKLTFLLPSTPGTASSLENASLCNLFTNYSTNSYEMIVLYPLYCIAL